MAHKEQRDFCIKVKEKYPQYFKNKKVLDIGSLDINGNNKFLFVDCNYLGIDVAEGKNVDCVSIGHLFDAPDNYFDTIISTEVFEHDMFYEKTIKNIMRMLKPGGLFLFTCAAPGRPEHGTRRQGESCAPLLIQISEEWADYYKNLSEADIRNIGNFNETFPDGYFEYKTINIEIPADLYFYGIKGGIKYLTNDIKPEYDKNEFKDHVFVIDCWPDTKEKENDLINLIKLIKRYGITIVLTSHYPIKPQIQEMVDYFIYDKKNPLLYSSEFDDYHLSAVRWTEFSDYKIENKNFFHHDYAIWESMRNAFNFCNYMGKKYIHFSEYDNLPDFFQYKQAFIERIKDFDAIIYDYNNTKNDADPYCATYIFSLKTEIALKLVEQIKNKEEYFKNKPNGWNLERVFYNKLKNITSNIKISDYIDNDYSLNKQAVWNRDGIIRNGAYFQVYLVADEEQNLYLHTISGFDLKKGDKDYLIEIDYDGVQKFILLNKEDYRLDPIGTYKKGKIVKAYYQGVEVFNEFLGSDFHEFREHNKLIRKIADKQNKLTIHFCDGPFLEIQSSQEGKFYVDFIDKKTNSIVYSANLKNNWWAKTNKKYFIDWKITINSDGYYFEENMDLKDKNVFIPFESNSLGDTIAWMPYVELFRLKHGCKIICSTFHNYLFEHQYPNITFMTPGNIAHNLYAMYRLGVFYHNNNYDENRHPSNPQHQPLGKIASDILGLDYVEIKPILPKLGNKKEKRVCIAIHSTAQCKYWNNESGWQEVVDYLVSLGYEVRLLSHEEDGYMGNKNPINVVQQPRSSLLDVLKVLQESEFFIGISSGLSWLSWASGTPTVIISGFTDEYLEPQDGIYRVINKKVCHGCWHKHTFNTGDWNWCPEHKGTDRQFECSKTITSADVIEKIQPLLSKNEN